MRIITARAHRLLDVCVREIGETAARGERCMFLVPAQYTLQAEIEIMTRLRLDGTFLIDVLSPGRLQSRVFERAGQPKEVVLDERGKCMILSEVIDQEKENLSVYRGAAQKGADGLTKKMSSLIADFKRSGKTAQEIITQLENMDESERLSPAAGKLSGATAGGSGSAEPLSGGSIVSGSQP